MDFGDRLKRCRNVQGLTQSQLAVMLGVTQGTVSAWESSANEPTFALLKRLAEILCVSTDYLLGHAGGNPPPPDFAERIEELAGDVLDMEDMLLDGEPLTQHAAAVANTMLIGTLEAVKSAQKRPRRRKRE